ncbi:MAG TPA: hypothetical protein VHV08_09345, partial [Pirellulales bacterium]|nr:hypothetical protein [Pirellulales bacterium]
MATETKSTPNYLEPAIESLLARLRRRIRAYLWADGVAAVIVFAGIVFWASLALDWLLEPPRALRAILLLAVTVALVVVVYRYLIARLLVRLADRNMALVLERRFRRFQDSLLTAVELAARPEHAAEFNTDMLSHAHRDALVQASEVDLGDVFNTSPLVRRLTLAAALAVGVIVFAVGASDAFGVWVRRSALLSDELWPRKTHLAVEGFDAERSIKIARGSDWVLAVKADAATGNEIPEVVEVRYSTADGARGRETMSREGIVLPGQGSFQEYSHTFKAVLAPLDFYVLGGDDRQGPYHLDVVDSPTISHMKLHCDYPPYMHRDARDIPVAGLMQVPRGTQITIEALANKPLVAVQIDDVADENTPLTHQLDVAAQPAGPRPAFRFSLAPLEADKTLLFTLRDADGIRSREAVRLSLSAIADEPPQVNVQLTGIGTAITPEARLPAAGEVADDYGVASLWFEYHVGDAAAARQPLAIETNGRQKLAVFAVFEVRDLQLAPKQKLHWAVQAADTLALEGGPNVGSSQRYALDVVSPEQLRAMLEARELVLRRRFETVIEELTDTRNLLAGIRLAPPKSQPGQQPAAPPTTGEAADAAAVETTEPRGTSAAVLIERVLQNSERSSHETLQVAVAFDDLREEMINNRIDTEELKTRLKDGVADPLKRIVAEMFPPLEERLKTL